MTLATNSLTRGAKAIFLVSFGLLCGALSSRNACAQDVLTERYNNARTGSTWQALNGASLRQGWGKLGELPVDGRVYAQPLFAQRVQISPTTPRRNLVFIATERNNIYAFDADSLSSTPVWSRALGANDRTKMGSAGCDGISVDGIGIEAIRAFLNAGVMENGLVSPSVEGTPQGVHFRRC